MTPAVSKPWRLVLVPHTHWDREWYFPYQRYRTRLVGFFDLLLAILDRDPEYKHFMLDGHTILIEDYLEVRPDRRALIERYIREGRLSAGPWYVIPDEFLPGGEALVRNLLRGHRTARELGDVMKVGYLPDPFGQIAHLPAILRGFGIERCVFWRGTDTSLDSTEFVWQSPDGSEVLVKHIRGGYGIGAPFPTDTDEFIEKIDEVRAQLEPYARARTMLVMWGSDHVPPQRGLSRSVREANKRMDGAQAVIGSLPQVFDELEAELNGRRGLPKRKGEFRSGQLSNVLPGVLSARMWIKQRTFGSEQLLARWAEPLTLWSDLLRDRLDEAWREPPVPSGPTSPLPDQPASEHGLIDRAWRLLLENQPHDSICGCSVDQTHDEMRPRFDQCDQVGEDLTQHAMRRIGMQGPAERVHVFNPLSSARTDLAEAVVPSRLPERPVALVDSEGRRSPCQPLGEPEFGRQPVVFVAGGVPAIGYRAYAIEYGSLPREKAGAAKVIENDIFRVEANRRDGSLTILDKRTKRRYAGMNRLVDGGDRGDEYNYCAPDPDVLIDAPATAPDIRVLERGPARSILEVHMKYRLPASLTTKRQRASRKLSCPVRLLVSLSPGVPRIDIRTEFENNAEDHRLRAHFPSGIQSDVVHAEQHFGVVTRTIALPSNTEDWQEQPAGYQPQKSFVDVNDGKRGIMIANRGLQEYEALQTKSGVAIALTLLRSVGWLSRDDYPVRKGHAAPPLATPGAQCLGTNVSEYAIIPHEGGWDRACEEAHRFAVPLRARWNQRGGSELADHGSFLEIEGKGLVVTALKRGENGQGAVVRVYNTLDRRTTGRLRLTEPWSRVQTVDLKEDVLGEADVSDGWVRLALKPNEIATFKFATSL